MNIVQAKKAAFRILTGLLFAVILFHLCIVAKLIPYNIAWGGRLEKDTQMYVFEAISILINVFLIIVLYLKNKSLNNRFSPKILNIILRIFFFLFLLNTIGNLFAKTNFEKYFAGLTFIFALLIWVILRPNKIKENTIHHNPK